jgi:mRNA degradation ribonuclease J1/J2
VANVILCTHSRFDHLGDVPYIARETGTKVKPARIMLKLCRLEK